MILLLGWILGGCWRTVRPAAMQAAAQLNLALLALGTMGGIGSVLAFGLSPTVRSYNRVSVFLAFLALLAVAFVADRLTRRLVRSRLHAVIFAVALAIGVLGVLDQTTSIGTPRHAQNEATYVSDEEFAKGIEQHAGADAMIFELPYVAFPEGASAAPYELCRPYLHSSTLRWSFGAAKGREGDEVIRGVAAAMAHPELFLQCLRKVGYSGVYLDRSLDSNHAIEAYLRRYVCSEPLLSRNTRLLFFPLSAGTPATQEGGFRHGT
jgi:phosphoglycerol transferase